MIKDILFNLLGAYLAASAYYLLYLGIEFSLRLKKKPNKSRSENLISLLLNIAVFPTALLALYFLIFYLAMSKSYISLGSHPYFVPQFFIQLGGFVFFLVLFHIIKQYIMRLRKSEEALWD